MVALARFKRSIPRSPRIWLIYKLGGYQNSQPWPTLPYDEQTGVPIKPDGRNYFTIDQIVERFGHTPQHWRAKWLLCYGLNLPNGALRDEYERYDRQRTLARRLGGSEGDGE